MTADGRLLCYLWGGVQWPMPSLTTTEMLAEIHEAGMPVRFDREAGWAVVEFRAWTPGRDDDPGGLHTRWYGEVEPSHHYTVVKLWRWMREQTYLRGRQHGCCRTCSTC